MAHVSTAPREGDGVDSNCRPNKTTPRSHYFPSGFYVANVMEIFERLAWYGFFTLSSLYMTNSVSQGGLGLSDAERGTIQGVIPFLLYLLPVFTGALGDRHGYKRMFFIAFALMTPGYYLLGQVSGFWPFFATLLLVAVGAAIFKPLVVATVSRTTNDRNRAMGFGIFYTMINVGGFVGPIVAGVVKGISWDWVFTIAACWIAVNFLLLLFYREPTVATPTAAPTAHKSGNASAGPQGSVLADITRVLRNRRFVTYLLIMSSFWACYNQLFLTLPLYIRDFVDTGPLLATVASFSPGIASAISEGSPGQISPEFITAFNFFSILVLQIAISHLSRQFVSLHILIAGTCVMAASFLWIGFGPVFGGIGIVLAVVAFSIGEMLTSPKSQEYVAESMPASQAALFMGYYFLSMALGFLLAGLLSGWGYGYLAKTLGRPDWMWAGFAALSIGCAVVLSLYHRTLSRFDKRASTANTKKIAS
ncbi:MFS transporter [Microbulbifer salipaludis]|uniref:MFS transporter n=1 Tax=Microbulbifer salipaludis TaxID=187980 RepID=A0ABS3E8L2_9GAMM|nr:MFS transporter [Microbulbifer salipaludis]MBN8431662.1 MFS transporter [Microbulbifer salipaludis]